MILKLNLFLFFYSICSISTRMLPNKNDARETDSGLNLIEGDMLFHEEEGGRQRRSVLTRQDLIWPGALLPYEFDTVFPVTEEIKNLTMKSFQHIMDRTCVRFVHHTNETNYLNITAQFNTSFDGTNRFCPVDYQKWTHGSCHSYVGRKLLPGRQELNLGKNCKDLSVIVHEILHALGFLHEQSRADRDQYVVVNYTNINPNVQNADKQFDKYDGSTGEASNQSIPYDLHSIMHYNRFIFSKFFPDGRLTHKDLTNRDAMTIYAREDYTMPLGNTEMSEKDILRVNLHYKCPVINTTTTQTTTTITQTTTTPTTTTLVTTTVISTNDSNINTTESTVTKSVVTLPETKDNTTVFQQPTTTSTTTSQKETQPNPRIVFVGDEKIVVNRFGIPDSSNTISIKFLDVLMVSLVAIYFCYYL